MLFVVCNTFHAFCYNNKVASARKLKYTFLRAVGYTATLSKPGGILSVPVDLPRLIDFKSFAQLQVLTRDEI